MERVLAAMRIEDCDEALALLRSLTRCELPDLRVVARLSIDDVLDRRNDLMAQTGCEFVATESVTGLPDNRCVLPVGHEGSHQHDIPRITSISSERVDCEDGA